MSAKERIIFTYRLHTAKTIAKRKGMTETRPVELILRKINDQGCISNKALMEYLAQQMWYQATQPFFINNDVKKLERFGIIQWDHDRQAWFCKI